MSIFIQSWLRPKQGMKIIRAIDDNQQIVLGALQEDGTARKLNGNMFTGLTPTEEIFWPSKLLAPLEPAELLGIGLNYRRHAVESGARIPEQPIVFAKGKNCVQNPEDPIEIPKALPSDEVDYECELAVVIGQGCKNATRKDALKFVFGYTCANDVSARDWQLKKGGGQWCRGKSFDTFAPLGPCLVTADEIPDPNLLDIRTELNGKIVQSGNTSDMIFDVPTLIEFLSGSTTLLPGTVILTGTPEGVGMAAKPPRWLRPGDLVSIKIDKIGTLRNPVVEERI
jgi:2-keto-4-pentenoate hydratase/2-oxohepta-3-ene-1,7-dioic acid hydratase in catechol pathway